MHPLSFRQRAQAHSSQEGNVGDFNFKILYGNKSPITIGKSFINVPRPTHEKGATYIYTFTPVKGKTYEAELGNISDGATTTAIGVINEKGVQYYCSHYNRCKFTAEDNSDYYIFFQVKESGRCQVSLTEEVSTGS